MNNFERKFIVNPEGQVEEKKITEQEKTNLNPQKPSRKNVLTMTDHGSFVTKDRHGKTVEVIKEGKKLEL